MTKFTIYVRKCHWIIFATIIEISLLHPKSETYFDLLIRFYLFIYIYITSYTDFKSIYTKVSILFLRGYLISFRKYQFIFSILRRKTTS